MYGVRPCLGLNYIPLVLFLVALRVFIFGWVVLMKPSARTVSLQFINGGSWTDHLLLV